MSELHISDEELQAHRGYLFKYMTGDTLATWCEELTHWKRPWCWERLKAGRKGGDRRSGGWMASPTKWTWVWASSRSWWWTGKPGVLQPMGSHRVRHNWATRLNWWQTDELFDSRPLFGRQRPQRKEELGVGMVFASKVTWIWILLMLPSSHVTLSVSPPLSKRRSPRVLGVFAVCIQALTACAQSLSRVQLCATPWTAARQAPLSMGFSSLEH